MPLSCLAFSWFDKKCRLEWIGIGVCKYIIEYYFLCVHAFYYILLGVFCCTLILLWQKMAVNLHVAHKETDSHAAHEALLACFLLSCNTWIISCVQHTKNGLHAVYESWLTCSSFRVTRMFWLESWQKL